jgi:ABC-type dipeptide/oligopeptide/nickel transport system ATPase component
LLSGINMDIASNSIGVVYGRSGSGKTTLLQLLSGLREHTGGSISMRSSDGVPLALLFVVPDTCGHHASCLALAATCLHVTHTLHLCVPVQYEHDAT